MYDDLTPNENANQYEAILQKGIQISMITLNKKLKRNDSLNLFNFIVFFVLK